MNRAAAAIANARADLTSSPVAGQVLQFRRIYGADASNVITELGQRLGGHVRAVAINMVVIAALSAGGLFLLGIPYPLVLALRHAAAGASTRDQLRHPT